MLLINYHVSGSIVDIETRDMKRGQFHNVNKAILKQLLQIGINATKITISEPGIDVLEYFTFSNLPFLGDVTISKSLTQIKSETFMNLPHINSIKITLNNITYLPTNCFFELNVRTINLNTNNIQAIHDKAFHNLRFLEELDLSSNRLITWNQEAFETIPIIRYLNLHTNKLQELKDDAFKNMRTLKRLMLINNNLKEIGLILTDLHDIKELLLQQNFLKSLPKNLFAPYFKQTGFPANTYLKRKLFYLDISLNHLSYLSETMLNDLNLIQSINTQLNPWNCNCITKIEQWSKKYGIKLNEYESLCINPDDPICIVPIIKNNRTCTKLNDDDIQEFLTSLRPYCELS